MTLASLLLILGLGPGGTLMMDYGSWYTDNDICEGGSLVEVYRKEMTSIRDSDKDQGIPT